MSPFHTQRCQNSRGRKGVTQILQNCAAFRVHANQRVGCCINIGKLVQKIQGDTLLQNAVFRQEDPPQTGMFCRGDWLYGDGRILCVYRKIADEAVGSVT